jgi:hypothetical protein
MRKSLWIILAVLAIAMGAPALHADSLSPGASGPPDPLTFGGTLLADTGVMFAQVPEQFDLEYDERVYSDPANVLCPGCVDFVYQFFNSPSSIDSIDSTTTVDYSLFMTDVGDSVQPGLLTSGLLVAPGTVGRSLDGATIGFYFSPGVYEGYSSADLVIETNAHNFTTGSISFSDSTNTVSAAGYAPAPTPEPSSLLLLGTGLLGLGPLIRRRVSRRA